MTIELLTGRKKQQRLTQTQIFTLPHKSLPTFWDFCVVCIKIFRPMDIFRRHHPPPACRRYLFFLDVSEKGELDVAITNERGEKQQLFIAIGIVENFSMETIA